MKPHYALEAYKTLILLIRLKNDQVISIRMLLKSIPATQNMCHSQLFQFIEPNSSGMVTLATYQAQANNSSKHATSHLNLKFVK